MHYKNFKTAVYIPAWIARHMTPEKLEYGYEFIEKYIGLDRMRINTANPTVRKKRYKEKQIQNFG